MSLVDRLLALLKPEPVVDEAPGATHLERPAFEAATRIGDVLDDPGEAMGRAMAGRRVTCFVGPDWPGLRLAVRRRLPLVLISPEPLAGAVFEMRPRNVQELVDLLLVAHAVAARSLVPCSIVWTEQPGSAALRTAADLRWLGAPEDAIAVPTEAQRIVFDAESRRRNPRWYDLDQPVLLGPAQAPEAALEAAAEVWFHDELVRLLSEQLTAWEGHCGRSVGRVRSQGSGAQVVVAAGPVTGTPAPGTRLLTLALTRPPLGLSEAVEGAKRLVVVDDAVPAGSRGPTLSRSDADLGPLLDHVGKDRPAPRFVGVQVLTGRTDSPRRQALEDRLERARPEVASMGVALGHDPEVAPDDGRVPWLVRTLGDSGRAYHSVARFWTETGVPHRRGLAPTADPYAALDLLPTRTAGLRDRSTIREQFPSFDPTRCTGCGACWVACPDSALHAVAVDPAELLGSDSALRPVAGKLTRALVGALDAGSATAGEALQVAADKILPKLPEDRAAPIRAALETRAAEIGPVQLASTDTLGPELLALAVDTDACSACGACSEACEDGAMLALPQEGRLDQARAIRAAFDQLPDTPQTVLERLGLEGFDALGTLLLTRACSMALAGGADGGAGDKRVIRALVAVCEARRQPRAHHRIHKISGLIARLSEQIDADLARVLPTDSGALANALARDALPDQVRDALAKIDQRALHNRAWLSHRLDQLRAAIPERARYGLVLTRGVAAALCRFPYNPFAVPVAVTDDPAEILGLVHSVVSEAVEEAGQLRSAADAAKGRRPGTTELPTGWEDLQREERAAVPPVVVITDRPPPASLLDAGLPLKVLLLVPRPDGGQAEELLALSRRGTLTLQSAIGDTAHLVEGLGEALEYDGPALMRVLTDPEASWPLLRFDATESDPLVAEARRLAEAAVADSHAAELARLKAEHAAALASVRAEVEAELATRIHGRLLQLAGYQGQA